MFEPGIPILYTEMGMVNYNPMTRSFYFRVGSKELIWWVILTPNAVDQDGNFVYRMEMYEEDPR